MGRASGSSETSMTMKNLWAKCRGIHLLCRPWSPWGGGRAWAVSLAFHLGKRYDGLTLSWLWHSRECKATTSSPGLKESSLRLATAVTCSLQKAARDPEGHSGVAAPLSPLQEACTLRIVMRPSETKAFSGLITLEVRVHI